MFVSDLLLRVVTVFLVAEAVLLLLMMPGAAVFTAGVCVILERTGRN